MALDKRSFYFLLKQDITDSAKLLRIALSYEEPDFDGYFHLPQTEWAETLGYKVRQLQRNIEALDEKHYIETRDDHDPKTGGKKVYVKPVDPITDLQTMAKQIMQMIEAGEARSCNANLLKAVKAITTFILNISEKESPPPVMVEGGEA
jgi:hypothetical protein